MFKFAKDVIYEDSARVDITRKAHLNGFWFFCKRTEWSNEEEVRLVLPRRKGSKVKIDPTWLTRLILGKNMSEAHEHEIRKWAKERQPELSILKAYYDAVDQKVKLRL